MIRFSSSLSRAFYQPALVTPEKIRAFDIAVDPVVSELKDWLEDNQDSRLFAAQFFEFFWNKYGVKVSVRKHKLLEAGLEKYGRAKLNNNQHTLYYRMEDLVVPAIAGQPLRVRLPDGKEVVGSKVLQTEYEDDESYKRYRSVSF